VNWRINEEDQHFLDFVRRMIKLRHDHPIFRRRKFFEGRPIHGSAVKDIAWHNPNGTEMSEEEWNQHFARSLCVYLSGGALDECDRFGQPIRDDDFLLLINAHYETIPFQLPDYPGDEDWLCVLDTAFADGLSTDGRYAQGSTFPLQGRTLALLTRPHRLIETQ
jgi:glycogen operon protein